MDIIQLPLSLIEEDKDQPRYQFDEEALQELMKSIEELGLLSPIKVRTIDGGRYRIIYGNRRYKASQMLGRETIPCIVSTSTDEMEIYLEQIAENLTREGFSPIEEAEAFDKLMNDGRFRSSLKFLSAKLGKPESYIKNKCELLKFSSAVKKLIVSGTEIRKDKLTEDQLMPLKDLPIEHRDPLALIAAKEELPVSDVKKIAKLFKDKTISDNTKEKLLLKTGSGLIETWSVYEQNRKERAKAAEETPAKQAAAQTSGGGAGGASGNAAGTAGGAAGAVGTAHIGGAGAGDSGSAGGYQAGAAASGAIGDAIAGATAGAAAAGGAGTGPAAGFGAATAVGASSAVRRSGNVGLSDLLEQLMVDLPRQAELTRAIAELSASAPSGGGSLFPYEIDEVIAQLEQQLAQWKALREQSAIV